jgi:transcriptional regulator with XRE-family HTH domain
MDDSGKIERLLLELQMDAQTFGKGIGKRTGDSIRNILNNKYRLSAKLASAIASTYNVSYKWLMTGKGEIFQKEEKLNETKSDNSIIEEKERIIKILLDRIEEQSRTIKVHEKCIEELSRREPEEKYRGSG